MDVVGDDALAGQLREYGTKTALKGGRVTSHYGALLQTKVKAHASGRPGPRAPTGLYRSGINLWTGKVGPDWVASVGTNDPQGRRLELGFSDTDSLGRSYDQPPYPHFGPALDEIEEPFMTALRAML